jgi:hypothetical protein
MLSNLLGYVKGGVAGIHVDRGIDLKANIECISEEGSRRVRDALKGGIGLARLNTKDDQQQMLKVYDTVKVNQSGPAVSVEAQVAPDLVDPLLNMIPALKNAAARSGI